MGRRYDLNVIIRTKTLSDRLNLNFSVLADIEKLVSDEPIKNGISEGS